MSEFYRGVRIKVPKGTVITGTFPNGTRVSRRDAYVVIDHIKPWPSDSPTSVVWAGHQDYWNEASVEDVEITEAKP